MIDSMEHISTLDIYEKKPFEGPVRRLRLAFQWLYRSYHTESIQQGLVAEYEAIRWLSTITFSYSGIEQAIKCLLEMRAIEFPTGADGHRIDKLFRKLAPQEQKVLRDSYAIYRSLHDYIPPATADDFLDDIGDGYTLWRYFLRETKPPPKTHPGAMLEIWSALADILDARVNHNRRLETVNRRIDERLRDLYEDALNDQLSDENQSQIKKLIAQLNEEIAINYCAEFLHRDAQGQPLSSDDQLTNSPILATLVDKIKGYPADHDLSYYLERARTSKLGWNSRRSRFESD